MKIKFLSIAFALVVAVMFTACSKGPSGDPAADAKQCAQEMIDLMKNVDIKTAEDADKWEKEFSKQVDELNKKYGWSKFIVVVPSIAIREGVKKSFDITQDHFYEQYGKKIRYFIYKSDNLGKIDEFSSSTAIQVMIINIQAFNKPANCCF